MKYHLYRASAVGAYAFASFAILGCKSKSASNAGIDGAAVANPSTASPAAAPVFRGFEGELDFVIKAPKKTAGASGEAVPVYLVIKGDKVRAEIPKAVGSKPMPTGHAVLDTTQKKLSLVMDEQKQIVIVDLNKTGEELKALVSGLPKGSKAARADNPSKPPPKITKTGTNDRVADIPCENWEVSDESHKMATFCVADQGSPFRLPIQGIPAEYAFTQELLDGKHFPLRMVAYDKAGAEEARVELTKLENQPLADVLFEMPAGYKIVDVGAMLGQLGGQGMPPAGQMPPMGQMPFGQPPKKHK